MSGTNRFSARRAERIWRMGEPNPKQRAFFLARTRFVAYGGARGGGKSWAVRKRRRGWPSGIRGSGF